VEGWGAQPQGISLWPVLLLLARALVQADEDGAEHAEDGEEPMVANLSRFRDHRLDGFDQGSTEE